MELNTPQYKQLNLNGLGLKDFKQFFLAKRVHSNYKNKTILDQSSIISSRLKSSKKHSYKFINLTRNNLSLHQPKPYFKPFKVQSDNIKSILDKDISNKSNYNFTKFEKEYKNVISTKNIETELFTNGSNMTIFKNNRIKTSNLNISEINEDIKLNSTVSIAQYINKLKRLISLKNNSQNNLVYDQTSKKFQSKLSFAKSIREAQKQRDKNIFFFLEKENPFTQINPKFVINNICDYDFLYQVDVYNRDQLKKFM